MAKEVESEQPELASKVTAKSNAKGELTVTHEPVFKPPEGEDVGVELELPAGSVSAEEETAAIRAFGGKPETCSTCRHEFQLQCNIGGMGHLKTVGPNDHCNSWG